MQYTKNDFAACRFNPMAEGRMVDVYPVLLDIVQPAWIIDPWLDSIIRYVIIVYDPKSPLVVNERDVVHRKTQAAALAMLDMENEELLAKVYAGEYVCEVASFPSVAEEEYDEPDVPTREPIMPELIFQYLMRFAGSKEWMAIVCFEYKFYEAAKILLTPVSGKTSKEELEALQKKSLVADEFDKDIKRLDALYKSFLADDTVVEKKLKKKRMSKPEFVGR